MAEMPDCKVKLNFEGREELEKQLAETLAELEESKRERLTALELFDAFRDKPRDERYSEWAHMVAHFVGAISERVDTLKHANRAALARLRKAPVAELRRIASEDYCGERLFESGLVCGLPKGHAEPYHKASVDMLACVGIDLADAIESVLAKLDAAKAPKPIQSEAP